MIDPAIVASEMADRFEVQGQIDEAVLSGSEAHGMIIDLTVSYRVGPNGNLKPIPAWMIFDPGGHVLLRVDEDSQNLIPGKVASVRIDTEVGAHSFVSIGLRCPVEYWSSVTGMASPVGGGRLASMLDRLIDIYRVAKVVHHEEKTP